MRFDEDHKIPSKLIPLLLLSLILGFQVCISVPRLNLPFVDSRIQWYFDNAFFLNMAVHSHDKTIPDFRKIFGVSSYEYNQFQEPVRVQFYNHHSTLGPALHLQFAKMIGFKEHTPRLFSLLLSLLCSILLFFTIHKVLDSSLIAFILTLLYVTMPLQLFYMDQMKLNIVESVVFFSLLFCYSRLLNWKYVPILFLMSAFLIFHTDYPIFLPAIAVAAFIQIRKEPFGEKTSLWFSRMLPVAILAGLVTAGFILLLLGFSPTKMNEVASFRMGLDQPALTTGLWLKSQWVFLIDNFGEIHLVFIAMSLIWIVTRPSLLKNFWIFSGTATLISTILYLIVFRNQSFGHHFMQWHTATGYILMLVGFAQVYGWDTSLRKNRTLAILVIPIFLLNFYQDYDLYKKCLANEFGSRQDIEIIRKIDNRILYFVNGASGPPDWWAGPVIRLYKDPIYTRKKLPFPEPISEMTFFQPQDFLVIIDNQKAVSFVNDFVRRRHPNAVLETVQKTPTFLFLVIQ